MNREDFNIGDKVQIKMELFYNYTGVIKEKLNYMAIVQFDDSTTLVAVIYNYLKKI